MSKSNMTIGYMFSVIFFVFVSGVIYSQAVLVYDFEDAVVPSEISPRSSLELSTNKFKNGAKSLEWQWTATGQLTWDLSSRNVEVQNKGGIKIWIYNSEKLIDKCLSVCIREESSREVSCFPMSLNFVGWRAAWVEYKKFIGCSSPSSGSSLRRSNAFRSGNKIDQLVLIAPSSANSAYPLYIDLLRFVQKISKASRDSVVPPLTREQSGETYCFSCTDMSTITEEIALTEFSRKAYWQHKYRWSLRTASPQPSTQVDSTKLNDISKIERRLVNWYSNESNAFTRIPYMVSLSDPFHIQRWDNLLKNFDRAHKTLVDEFEYPPTSGLFARNSEYGGGSSTSPGNKFSELFYKVLHPLTLEYHIKSRRIEVDHAACLFAQKYTCSPGGQIDKGDIIAITGKDRVLRNNFKTLYRSPLTSTDPAQHPTCSSVSQACFNHVVKAIDDLNDNRKTKIFTLFDYIKEHGWVKGSALGSMDHELLGMSGFAHSVFLMRNELKTAKQLDDMIDVMKWYMEFGEVYQTSFEFQGSTADRIRTVLLFRLMTVLIMPEDNDLQKREKIRDMDALQRWIENALSISEGLSDLIKPDYTSYHHRFFYATAYCPSALHTAALISYLLDETAYHLNSDIKENLVNALKVYRIAAVHYSTPSQIGGRNPKYDQAIIAEHVPAYAYLAMKSPLRRFKLGTNFPNLNVDLSEVRMFLRLYEHTTGSNICTSGKLNEFLCDGNIGRKYYLNTLGALEIMERVKVLASIVTSGERLWQYQTEQSPSGHWTKQFASLSIQRRDDWAVTVKGFDKFVVDFESSMNPVGNLYGMYSSHGAMLIANNESALSSKDVDNGWDWRKIPGTTVINVDFSEMRIESSHHYNPSSDAMAGGVALKGSQDWVERNGVFGMNFEQPRYEVSSITSPFSQSVTFRFKKSVYFYDDLIVSLGSSIRYSGGNKEIHTALFQDKMPQTPSPKTAEPDVFRCNDGQSLRQTVWQNKRLVTLVDVNGNRYYIPNPDNQGLVFSRNTRQDSVKGDEKTATPTNGMYCTAWFNHGGSPSTTPAGKDKYEYAVQVDAEPVGGSPKPPLVPGNSYSVIMNTNTAHVVKFSATSKRGIVYGYVVFPINPSNPVTLGNEGPLLSVHNQSVIMTEETTNPAKLHISVITPQLNLKEKPGSPSWCQGGTTSPRTSEDVDETLLFCSKSTSQAIHVNLRENAKWSTLAHLYVGGKDKTENKDHYLVPTGPPRQNPVKFINMRDGADTEVEFSEN